jgi:hypothetical protein
VVSEVFRVLEIKALHNPVVAEVLYKAAYAVFKSLPPLHLLVDFDQAAYQAWYRESFDEEVFWGPELYQAVQTPVEGRLFILKTPTSGRLVEVEVVHRRLHSCRVIFPGGSQQAACDVMNNIAWDDDVAWAARQATVSIQKGAEVLVVPLSSLHCRVVQDGDAWVQRFVMKER